MIRYEKGDDAIPLENEMTTVIVWSESIAYQIPWWAVLEWEWDSGSRFWWLFGHDSKQHREMRAATMLEF